jgi:hypothetical protein
MEKKTSADLEDGTRRIHLIGRLDLPGAQTIDLRFLPVWRST